MGHLNICCVLVFSLIFSCGKSSKVQPPLPATDGSIKLAVVVVIDQWPSWSLLENEKGFSGGIKQLLTEGVAFENGEYPYGITYTSPGHATLGTGAPPRTSGVIANKWVTDGKLIRSVEDPKFPVFDSNGNPTLPGRSGTTLLVPGIAQSVRQNSPRSKVITVAGKDRAALFVAGKDPHLALWYDKGMGRFTTSTYFTDKVPPWLQKHAETHNAQNYENRPWTPSISPEKLATLTGIPDKAAGEYKQNPTFPHTIPAEKNNRWLSGSPYMDELTLLTAQAAIQHESLGKDDAPDLLVVSFSSHDYIGHIWGQESWERTDQILRLDKSLATLFSFLDKEIGVNQYAVLLTSDHGATRMVNRSAPENKAVRVNTQLLHKRLESRLDAALGDKKWIEAVTTSDVFLSQAATGLSKEDSTKLDKTVWTTLSETDGIGHVYRRDAFSGNCTKESDIDKAMCFSAHPKRSGHYLFAARRFSLISSEEEGTGHAAPHPEERRVPILIKHPSWVKKRTSQVVSILNVAPTITAWLGVPPPQNASSPKSLEEILTP